MLQIAVACGWICILNVLTILALKYLNRERLRIANLLQPHSILCMKHGFLG